MTTNVTIQANATSDGIRIALAKLPKSVTEGKYSKQLLTRLSQVVFTLIRESFLIKSSGGTDAAGDRWAPLQPSTILARKRKGGSKRYRQAILRDSGKLLKSLSPSDQYGISTDQIFRIEKGAIVIGTKRKGAMTHHYGSPKKGIPQRKLWPDPQSWPDSWWKKIKEVIVEEIVKITKEIVRDARGT